MKKIKMFAKNIFKPNRMKMAALMLLCGTAVTFAQNAAGDYTAGTNALSTVTEEIAKYIPYVVKLCYAIAGVVAVVGAISVYIAMNNEEQDVKKKIMMVVGACIFLDDTIWQKRRKTASTSVIPCSRDSRNLLNLWEYRDATSHGRL